MTPGSAPTSNVDSEPRRRRGCVTSANGVMIIVSALGVGVFGWIALHLLGKNAAENPDVIRNLPPLATWMLAQRSWFPAMVLPSIVVGALLLIGNPGRGVRWVLASLAALWLCVIFVLIVITFVQFMAPLYQYQPI
jgi:hypothetical protein